MSSHFSKHYTREEARALLPDIRRWLGQLQHLRELLKRDERQIAALLASGNDIGGESVNHWARTLVEVRDVLEEFRGREIQIKDLDRGLIDFPSFVGGKEVFLCWEQDEDDIEFWHDLNSGYAGREKLDH